MSDAVIIKSVFFKASAGTVFSFLTDREKLGRWYHPAKQDLEAGQPYALMKKGAPDEAEPLIWGRVIEMKAPYKLVQTFCIKPFGDSETTLIWQLEECAGGTMLTLRHEGVEQAAGAAVADLLCSLDAGWDEHLAHYREVANG